MIFFSNNLLDLIIYPHSYILPDIFFFHLNPLVSVKIFFLYFSENYCYDSKTTQKYIYNDVSKTKKKLFLFFGGLLYANTTHYNKTRTQKIYLYIYI